jgi:membrane-associated phospholipid phosphatase
MRVLRVLSATLAGLFALTSTGEAAPPVLVTKPLTSTEKHIEDLGTGVAIAMPLIAGGISVYKHDWTGVAQLGTETFLTVGTAYALKQIVKERRPDGSDFQSFPSDTTALSASGSSYLWGRYGWSYGLPAFFATQFVSYSRVQAKQHHWYDTLASSAIAAGYGYAVTTPFKKRYGVTTNISATPNGAYVQLSYEW